MPITPYHLGPGLLLKALAPRHVSFAAFVLANVVIDVETAVNVLTGQSPLHAALHTVAGALVVGVGCGLAVRRASVLWSGVPEVGRGPALAGGVLGGLSQTVLDAIMHADLRPFLPVSGANPLLGAVGWEALHTACVVLGVAGLVGLGARLGWERVRGRGHTGAEGGRDAR